jgi:hypothetical protein
MSCLLLNELTASKDYKKWNNGYSQEVFPTYSQGLLGFILPSETDFSRRPLVQKIRFLQGLSIALCLLNLRSHLLGNQDLHSRLRLVDLFFTIGVVGIPPSRHLVYLFKVKLTIDLTSDLSKVVVATFRK